MFSGRYWWSSPRYARRAVVLTSSAGRVSFTKLISALMDPTTLAGISQPFVRPCPFGCLIHWRSAQQYSPWRIPPEWDTSREYSAAFLLGSSFSALATIRLTWLVIYYYVKYGMYLVKRWIMISGDKDGGQIVVDVHESKYAAVKGRTWWFQLCIINNVERVCIYNITYI